MCNPKDLWSKKFVVKKDFQSKKICGKKKFVKKVFGQNNLGKKNCC